MPRPVLAVLALAVAIVAGYAALGGSLTSHDRREMAGAPPVASAAPRLHRVAAPTFGVKLAAGPQRVKANFRVPPRGGLLFDLRTGRVLWRRGAERHLKIASLTKMMTALVVAAHLPQHARVTITRQALAFQGSGVGVFRLHQKIDAETMLYGLLLPSGNDAAIALAQRVAGSTRAFIRLMNTEAAALRLHCTHFTSVDGFEDRGNYSCAPDLAVIAREMLRSPRLAKIIRSPRALLPFPTRGGRLDLFNNNPLLRLRYPGTDGVKTGFTALAGHCLVAAAHRGRTRLGVVLLHSPDTGTQARLLLDRGFRALGA
ncbi:MAG: D-alanyl-D-alanine carboxypeptidase family protein [Solirubrobacteraceae bacterium]